MNAAADNGAMAGARNGGSRARTCIRRAPAHERLCCVFPKGSIRESVGDMAPDPTDLTVNKSRLGGVIRGSVNCHRIVVSGGCCFGGLSPAAGGHARLAR